MQELAIRAYLVLGALTDRVGELRKEEGQTAAEYVGILAFVAAVVGVVIAASSGIGAAIVGKIQSLIASIGG